MGSVATSQITIFDNNDAKSISQSLVGNSALSQSYGVDNGSNTFKPSWVSSPLVLTPNIAIGSLDQTTILGRLKNRKFVLNKPAADGGTVLASGSGTSLSTSPPVFVDNTNVGVASPLTVANDGDGAPLQPTLTISANLSNTYTPSITIYFEADYVDPAVNQSTHIICLATLQSTIVGSNAVWVDVTGTKIIQKAAGLEGSTAIAAKLMRQSGVDTTNLTYKWYEVNAGTGNPTLINQSLSGWNTKYAMKNTDFSTTPTPVATGAVKGTNVPVSNTGNSYSDGNTLVIWEAAILGIKTYRVEITDGDSGVTYASNFDVIDKNETYAVSIASDTGYIFQNGVGTATLTPVVISTDTGQVDSVNMSTWTFKWTITDSQGRSSGFVDTAKLAGGTNISANNATTLTVASATGLVAGDLIKLVKSDGFTAFFAEVQSVSGNVITIKSALAAPNTTIAAAIRRTSSNMVASEFVSGKLYYAKPFYQNTGDAPITVTGNDIDSKANISLTVTK